MLKSAILDRALMITSAGARFVVLLDDAHLFDVEILCGLEAYVATLEALSNFHQVRRRNATYRLLQLSFSSLVW